MNEKTKNIKYIKSSNETKNNICQQYHRALSSRRRSMHRKTTSNLLGNEDIQSIYSLDQIISQENIIIRNKSCNGQKTNQKNILDNNKKDEIEFSNFNLQSFDTSENNSSVLIKDEKLDNNLNLIPKAPNKSFIPLRNTLKYVKDKEESATESYLLALGLETRRTSSCFINDRLLEENSVIEEEKSELMGLDLESSVKKNFKDNIDNLNTIKILDNSNKKNKQNDIQNNNDNIDLNNIKSEHINHHINSDNNSIYYNNNCLNSAINDLMKRKNEKEQNLRRLLDNNKKIILSSFFNNTYNNTNTTKTSSVSCVMNNNLSIGSNVDEKKENNIMSKNIRYSLRNIKNSNNLKQFTNKSRSKSKDKDKKISNECSIRKYIMNLYNNHLNGINSNNNKIPRKSSNSKKSVFSLNYKECDKMPNKNTNIVNFSGISNNINIKGIPISRKIDKKDDTKYHTDNNSDNKENVKKKHNNFTNAVNLINIYKNKFNNLSGKYNQNYTTTSSSKKSKDSKYLKLRSRSIISGCREHIYNERYRRTRSSSHRNEINKSLESEQKSNKSAILTTLTDNVLYKRNFEKSDVTNKLINEMASDNSFYIILCEEKEINNKKEFVRIY